MLKRKIGQMQCLHGERLLSIGRPSVEVNERQMDLSTETLDVRYSPIPYARYDIADCWRNFKGKFSLPPLMLHHGDIHQNSSFIQCIPNSLFSGLFSCYTMKVLEHLHFAPSMVILFLTHVIPRMLSAVKRLTKHNFP